MAGSRYSTSDDAEGLSLRRHAFLSTALPFPQLDWSSAEANSGSLEKVRDYCETLGHSTLDWYLEHHQKKKRWAKWLHFFMYLFVAAGGIPPLLKLGFDNLLKSIFDGLIPAWLTDAVTNHAGELSIFFLGIAGAIKIWDSNFGFTVDWMRFITTGVRLNQELTKFQFDWEHLDLKQRLRAGHPADKQPKSDEGSTDQATDQAPGTTAPSSDPEVCPTCGHSPPIKALAAAEEKLKLATDFCTNVFAIVNSEISVWAEELKKRVDRLPTHGSPEK